jgi:hypothetical protein
LGDAGQSPQRKAAPAVQEPKKFCLFGAAGRSSEPQCRKCAGEKVFCFFFSKKKVFFSFYIKGGLSLGPGGNSPGSGKPMSGASGPGKSVPGGFGGGIGGMGGRTGSGSCAYIMQP